MYIPLALLKVPHALRSEELMSSTADRTHACCSQTFRRLGQHVKQGLESNATPDLMQVS